MCSTTHLPPFFVWSVISTHCIMCRSFCCIHITNPYLLHIFKFSWITSLEFCYPYIQILGFSNFVVPSISTSTSFLSYYVHISWSWFCSDKLSHCVFSAKLMMGRGLLSKHKIGCRMITQKYHNYSKFLGRIVDVSDWSILKCTYLKYAIPRLPQWYERVTPDDILLTGVWTNSP